MAVHKLVDNVTEYGTSCGRTVSLYYPQYGQAWVDNYDQMIHVSADDSAVTCERCKNASDS